MVDPDMLQLGDRLQRADGQQVDVLWLEDGLVHVVDTDGTETDEPPDNLSPLVVAASVRTRAKRAQ